MPVRTITKYDINLQPKTITRKEYGKGSRSCRACFTNNGLIRSYNVNLCRRCFREYADDIGFKVFD